MLQSPSRRWNSTTLRRRSGTEDINLDTESTCSMRKSRRFFWMIRKGLHQQRIFKTHIQMPVQHEMISGPSLETSYTASTLNQESNSLHQEKNHFLFHWVTWRHQSHSYYLGCIAGKSYRWLFEHRWVKYRFHTFFWKTLQEDTCGPGWDKRNVKQHPDLITCGPKCGEVCQGILRWKRNKIRASEAREYPNAPRY